MSLSKNDIIEKIAERLGHTFSRSQSSEALEVLLEIIKNALENGEDVLVSGFGKFCVQEKKERMGRNPATGTSMILPARKIVTFKCSGVLREKLTMTNNEIG